MRAAHRLLAALAVAVPLLAGCGDDDSANDTPAAQDGDDLRPADEVNGREDADGAVTGSIGEPAQLVNDFGQDVTVTLRSAEVVEDPERGQLLVVHVRAENATDAAQNAPEIELWCDAEQMAFYGGSYEWQEMPARTILEGTREFEYPQGCDAEVRATALAGNGESVRWQVNP